MLTLDVWLDAVAVGGYFLAFCCSGYRLLSSRDRWKRTGRGLIWFGFVFQALGLIVRWWWTGHAPANVFESTMLGSWIAVGIYLVLIRIYPYLSAADLVLLPLVIGLNGYGLTMVTAYEPLKPEYQSYWLVFHIIFAFLATGCYMIGFSVAIQELLGIAQQRGTKVMSDLKAKLAAMGFAAHFAMIVSGAVWAQEAWGSYWSWDPIETWSLITWLIYGLYLHLYYTVGWRGKKMNWLMTGCFLAVIFCYWLVPHIPVKNFMELYK